jgi:hypothetical protein
MYRDIQSPSVPQTGDIYEDSVGKPKRLLPL